MMESVNSTTFIKKPPPPLTDTAEKFLFTKELLSNRIFSGFFRERKYVAKLNEYRDVVIINPEESDLLQDIDRLRKKWDGVSDIKWVGITGSEGMDFPEARCFWVKLSNLAFGQYWFLIKHVKLKDGEIFLQLRCLRKIGTSETKISQVETYLNRNEVPETSASTNEAIDLNLDPKKVASSLLKTCNNVYQSIHSYVTWRSLFDAVRTTCAFIVFLIVGSACIVCNLGEFTLKLLREITLFVHAFSPIVVQIIDLLSKIIGGFFILLAGMFASNRNRRGFQPFNKIPSIHPATPVDVNWRERNQKLRRELYLTH